MSHTTSVTRTTTTVSGSAIILNTGLCKSPNWILKVLETIVGGVVLGLVAHQPHNQGYGFVGNPEQTLLFLVSFAFLVTTFLFVVSGLISLMAATVIPKTIFEFLYHLFAFIFYVSASLAFLITVTDSNRYYRSNYYEKHMAAAVLGLANAVMYLLSTIFSFRSYRMG